MSKLEMIHSSWIWKTLLPMLAYLGVAVMVLGANPFTHRTTVGPFDLLANQGGWVKEVPAVAIRNMERSDILDSLLPRWLFARKTLRSGSLPLWDPIPKGGGPGMQNLANAELTPAFAIFVASSSPERGFYLATLFNLTLIGWGVFFWLRRRTATLPAMFGGFAVMLCGFHAAWLYWPHTMTSMWVCWLLWALDCWWERGRLREFMAIVLFSALLMLGGFPFVALLGYGTAVLYLLCLLVRDFKTAWPLRLVGFALAIIASVGVCAVPAWSFAHWLSGMDISYRTGGSSLSLFGDLKFLLPHYAKNTPYVESTMYVGVIASLAGIVGWLIVLFRKLRVPVLGLFALLLGLVGFTLVFEIIPAAYMSWVPGLANNPWSRAIILLDIAFATAAVYALDAWRRHGVSRVTFVAVMSVLVLCQVVDQAKLFRKFNGPVANVYFYPRTKLIAYVQDHLKPFQSAVADDNFLVSGTLGAYGIPEWLAHAFNVPWMEPDLDMLATDPMTSRTAARVDAAAFHLTSPMMNALEVRYALGDAGLNYQALDVAPDFVKSTDPLPGMRPIPPLPDHRVRQYFVLGDNYRLQDIDIRFATYAKRNLKGTVTLRLYDSTHPKPLAQSSINASSIADNMMTSFELPSQLNLVPGKYSFTLEYAGAGQDKLTAWFTPADALNCSLQIDAESVPGCLDVQFFRARAELGAFVQVASSHGISLLENTQAPDGPYFLARLDQWPDRSSSARTVLSDLKNRSFVVEYNGTLPGYVVVPMNLAQGWRVRLNGRDVTPAKYIGGLPAVKVTGSARIKYYYSPDAVVYGKWISLLSVLLLMLVGIAPGVWRRIQGGQAVA